MTFYEELKALCKKYDCYAGVYVRAKDPENTEKHKVFCITDTDNPTVTDIGMTIETIMYFFNALIYAANNKFYAMHVILDVLSMVIKTYKDEDNDEKDTDGVEAF